MAAVWLFLAALLPTAVLSQSPSSDVSTKTLKLVQVVFRHGDRTPVNTYPTDPYKDPSNWPIGWGQLTNNGKERHYHLGHYLRQRYDAFLSETYSDKEVYVRSTDVDRTLMSAASNLAGLFPPKGDQRWDQSLEWQPIPIHTVPQAEDLLLSLSSECPLYDRLTGEFEASPTVQSLVATNKELFTYLTLHTGQNVSTIVDIEYLYDVLFIEDRFNMTLPAWTAEVYPDKLRTLSDFSFAMKAYTKEMQRLRGGPLVKEMTNQMSSRVGWTSPSSSSTSSPSSLSSSAASRKLFMYSAHDVTLAAFLSALGVFNGIQPPYAAMVLLELHEPRPDHFVVQVWYKNVSFDGMEPFLLTVPGCDSTCPLERFLELTRPVVSDDVRAECSLSQPLYPARLNGFDITVLAVSSALIFLLLLVIAAGCIMWRRDRTRGFHYSSVQVE